MKKLVLILALLLVAAPLGSQNSEDQGTSARMLLQLEDVVNIVANNYVDPVPSEDLYLEAIKGLVESLDPNSELLDLSHRKRLMEQTTGEFGGIGIEISIRDDSLTVLAPIPGTPASQVGLMAGDRIVRIENEPTAGMSLEDAVNRLKGQPGTQVNITVIRMGFDGEIPFSITRAIIKIESVQAKFMLTPDVGYLRLAVFREKSGLELEAALNELKEHGMRKLIFDLRDNPGGLLSRAVDMADIFLDPGQVIVSTRGRISSSNKIYNARRPAIWGKEPIITLINGGSASASEIVAGALQDHDKAVIMGTTSYGKGSVQTIIDLRDNFTLKLTTAKYYTPSGRCIHADRGVGEDHESLLSAEDTLKTFTTDSGRTVHGGGGITPDLILKPDSMGTVERKIFRKISDFRNLMFHIALEYKSENPKISEKVFDNVAYQKDFRNRLFEITPAMVDEAFKMMKESGFDLNEAESKLAVPLVRQWMSYHIADVCFDRNTAQRIMADFDEQLLKAVELMEKVPAQANFVETLLAGRVLPDTIKVYSVKQ